MTEPRLLILMRHARAAPGAAPGAERALTPEGMATAVAQGRLLVEIEPRGPVLASPALRCQQTARAVAQARGSDHVVTVAELAEGAGTAELLALARSCDDGAILVGHQPDLGALASALVGPAAPSFAPATAAVLARGSAGWSVHRVLHPT